MSRIRRACTPEFKQEAVRQVVEQGRPVSQVAREYSLRPEHEFLGKAAAFFANGSVRGTP